VTESSQLRQFNPVSPELLKDPYPTYAAYREADPVHWGTATLTSIPGSWYLFQYDHNSEVLSEGKLFANDPATVGMEEMVPAAFKPVAYIFQHWLGGMDPPKHRILRAALAKAFTPRRITALEPGIVEITQDLIATAMARSDGQLDVRADLAFPMPMAVVGAALGVAKEDWSLFQGWSADVTNAVDHAGDPEYATKGAAAIKAMADYFAVLVERCKRSPGDDLVERDAGRGPRRGQGHRGVRHHRDRHRTRRRRSRDDRQLGDQGRARHARTTRVMGRVRRA